MERTLGAGLDFGFQKLSVCLAERNLGLVGSLDNVIVCCLFEVGDGLGSLLEVEVVVH